MKAWAICASAIVLAGCTTTATKVATVSFEKPGAGSTILLMKPDITLAALTASGVGEPRADWMASASQNLSAEAREFAQSKGLQVKEFDPAAAEDQRVQQVIKLNSAVSQSIRMHAYALALPSKTTFDWTLGDGAKSLADREGATYALFINGSGTYSTAGRAMMQIFAAAAGVGIAGGGQSVFVSLVELKTGRVMWTNAVLAGPNDMRKPEGADLLAKSLFKDAPL
ncbi:MAG TPA: hypothetical protein VG735_16515 [Caulobacterales bacterium]|nr:hypothetical protein [Caulobacterales bacterium]